MAGRYDPDPGRWVCAKPLSCCDGTKRLYTEKVPCPLAGKCKENPRNHYEFPLTRYGTRGRFLELYDPKWRALHAAKRREVLQAFAPDTQNAYGRAYRQRNNDLVKKRKNEKRKVAYMERDSGQTTELDSVDVTNGRGVRKSFLPCGEDCENCPYPDGICRYTDEDEDALLLAERGGRKYYKKDTNEGGQKIGK